MKAHIFGLILGAMIAQSAIAQKCPITECNYLDPQYQAAFAKFEACMNNVTENFNKFFRTLAITHPRFGIAYNAYLDEMNSAVRPDGTVDNAAMQAAKQRFDDRILRTAEPEALELYNQFLTKNRATPLPCGTMPEPPKGQPAQIK
jgi:hypothetical protein